VAKPGITDCDYFEHRNNLFHPPLFYLPIILNSFVFSATKKASKGYLTLGGLLVVPSGFS
jgi:hypothetical protein